MQGAFANAQCLTSVEIASGATYIPSRAFYNCSNLSEIIVPDSVYQIGQDAFNNTAYYKNRNRVEIHTSSCTFLISFHSLSEITE